MIFSKIKAYLPRFTAGMTLFAIGLHDIATGSDHSALIEKWVDYCKEHYIDKSTGLLIQAIGHNGLPIDKPRGSGSTLGLYFLSFIDREFAEELYSAVKRELATTLLSFGVVREYPIGTAMQRMDIYRHPLYLHYHRSSIYSELASDGSL